MIGAKVMLACAECGNAYPGVEVERELRPIGTDECTGYGGTQFTKLDTDSTTRS